MRAGKVGPDIGAAVLRVRRTPSSQDTAKLSPQLTRHQLFREKNQDTTRRTKTPKLELTTQRGRCVAPALADQAGVEEWDREFALHRNESGRLQKSRSAD